MLERSRAAGSADPIRREFTEDGHGISLHAPHPSTAELLSSFTGIDRG
jgi:hypothetical protein